MIYNTFKKHSGFTLIEILMYLAITSVLVVVLADIGLNMLSANAKTERIEDAAYVNSFVLTQIEHASEQAVGIALPTVGSTTASLIFTMSDPAKNPTIFKTVDGVLTMQQGISEAIPLHPEVFQMTLSATSTYVSGATDMVTLGLRVQSQEAVARNEFEIDTQIQTTLLVHHAP